MTLCVKISWYYSNLSACAEGLCPSGSAMEAAYTSKLLAKLLEGAKLTQWLDWN